MKFTLFLVTLWSITAQESPGVIAARHDVERIQQQVASGGLPAAKLAEAQQNLEDAIDLAELQQTLYSHIQDFTEIQATEMADAAKRRVERQKKKVSRTNELIAADLVPRGDRAAVEAELSSRESALENANKLAGLVREMAAMARLEAAAPPEIKTGGSKLIGPQELKELTFAFEKRFSEPFPISARGMTAVHKALGFDHTGRVDVALNPDSREGMWLREYLDERSIPYYAFRTAMAGKATAPHIHIGPASTRLLN